MKLVSSSSFSHYSQWGITKYPRETHVELRRAGNLSADVNMVKVHTRRGLLDKSALYLTGQE
jgi:large subunit ribosomal protein L10e